jgi:hypothetical protein
MYQQSLDRGYGGPPPQDNNMANLKTKLSAAMLALIAAGASAPVLFDQFISEKEGNALVAVVDPGGVGHCATV